MNETHSTPPRRLTYKEAAELCRTYGWNLEAIQEFARAWSASDTTNSVSPDDGWQKSITTFTYYGLNGEDFQDFIKSIERKGENFPNDSKWRYFCGCAWQSIKVIKDVAENGGIDQ